MGEFKLAPNKKKYRFTSSLYRQPPQTIKILKAYSTQVRQYSPFISENPIALAGFKSKVICDLNT